MNLLLRRIEKVTTGRPWLVIFVLALVVLGLGSRAVTLDLEADMTQFGDDDSVAVQAMDRVQEDFNDPSAVVQVIVDAGESGDVLGPAGLTAVEATQELALDAAGAGARTDPDGSPQAMSVLDGPNPTLLSDDADLADGSARATVIMIPLDQTLSETERTEIAERIQEAFDDPGLEELSDVDITVYSLGLFGAGLLDAVQEEVPMLFGLALIVVLGVLWLMYRSWFDVATAFIGLIATVIATMGVIALLGPGHLGLTGPPSQLLVIIPVLLVGLGIDYSMHLNARYREQRATGEPPKKAISGALSAVGVALIIATIATAAGFAATATAPLAMLADLGIFVGAGVIVAFFIMMLLVPAARVLLDRRRHSTVQPIREIDLGRLMNGPVALARRAPAAGLIISGALMAASLLAATQLQTEFDRDDFIPEGSGIAESLDHQQQLFGAGVSESTFVVVDADFTDPQIISALQQSQDDLSNIEGVRMIGGQPQVRSILTLTEAADLDLDDETDMEETYQHLRDALGEDDLDQVLASDDQSGLVQIRTTAGDAGAEGLNRDIRQVFAPIEAAGGDFVVTSEPAIVAEMSQDLSEFQLRSIVLTLLIVLGLLSVYYRYAHTSWSLGAIAMIPAASGAALIAGFMWALGFSFNILTATMTAIAIGIGVPYGVHVINRFVEASRHESPADAAETTLRHTGGALAAAAVSTLGAFAVLAFSSMPPMRSLGLLGGTGIAVALLAAQFVVPGALVLWGRRRDRLAVPARTTPAGSEHLGNGGQGRVEGGLE